MDLPKALIESAVKGAQDGETILIIDQRGPAGDLYFMQNASTSHMIERVSHVNGQERIDYTSGGSIRCLPNPSWARGHTADQIYYAHGNINEEQAVDLIPCLKHGNGTLVGYH